MGRQKGKQQRTKGNIAPSSSSRSAELLSKEYGSSESSMFQTMKTGGLGNVPELDGLDTITNPDFRIVMKKLNKRDCTTKLKALSEFSSLCETSDEHEVLSILPYWPRIYGRLFEDSDRRVRENGQKALHSLVKSVGKNLAPHLKSFMGHWFISQCDPYAPCSFEADASIATAFRDEKKLDAFIFCRKEILKLVTTYLFKPITQPVKEKSPEDDNIHRIVACSIEALALYIKTVTKRKPDDEEIETVLSNPKFWKFQRHKYPQVRGAFYSVIEAMAITLPELLRKHLTGACKSVFHRLDESNIAVCKPLYGAAVAITVTFDSWHEAVDLHKGMVPNLCSSLKAGCHGMTGVVLPSLLPLLSKFPSSCNLLGVFSKILAAVHTCIYHEQVWHSRQAVKLTIMTYIELLQLAASMMLQPSENGVHQEWTQLVMKDHIIPELAACFKKRDAKFANIRFYELVAKAVQSWTAKSLQAQEGLLGDLCKCFWVEVNSLIHSYTSPEPDPAAMLEMISFLSELAKPHSPKKAQRVIHFSTNDVPLTDEPRKDELPETGSPTLDMKSRSTVEAIQQNINETIASHVFTHPLPCSREMLRVHLEVFKHLGNLNLFKKLLNHYPSQEAVGNDGITFFTNMLVPDVIRIMEVPDFSSDQEVLEILPEMMFHCLVNCAEVPEMPKCLLPFCRAGVQETQFKIFLHLVLKLSSESKYVKIAPWIGHLLEERDSDAWNFTQTLTENITPCKCIHTDVPYTECKDGWLLFSRLLTAEIEDDEGFLCTQKGFENVMGMLLSRWRILEQSCTCNKCSHETVKNILSLMMTCASRNFDHKRVSNSKANIWLDLAAAFLKTSCSLAKNLDGKQLLGTVYHHIINSLCVSGEIPNAELSMHIKAQLSWIKNNMLLNMGCDADNCASKIKDFLGIITPLIDNCQMKTATLIEQLLPDSEEWERVRPFKTLQWSDYESVISSQQLPHDLTLRIESQENVARNDHYLAIARVYSELTNYILDTHEEACKDLKDAAKMVLLCEEFAIALVLGDTAVDLGSFMERTGMYDHMKSHLLEKSSAVGGVWPHCIERLRLCYDDTCEKLYQDVCQALDSNQALHVAQTLISVINVSPKTTLSNLLTEKPLSVEAGAISTANIYSFSVAINMLNHDCQADTLQKYFDLVLNWRSENENLFLFDCDLSTARSDLILLNSDIAKFFSIAIKASSGQLIEEQWDFVCCSLVSWLESISATVVKETGPLVLVLRLLDSVSELVTEINLFMASPALRDDPTIPSNLAKEWSEFFSPSVYQSLIRVFLDLCNNVPFVAELSILRRLCDSLGDVRTEDVKSISAHLKPHLTASSCLPNEIQTLLHHISPLLFPQTGSQKGNLIMQATAYKLLHELLPEVKATEGRVNPPVAICGVIKDVLDEVKSIFVVSQPTVAKAAPDSGTESEDESDDETDDPIADHEFEASIQENVSQLLAYLLSWKLLLRVAKHIPSEEKVAYIDTLMKGSFPSLAEDLLPKLFKLMPEKSSLFKDEPQLVDLDLSSKDALGHVACSVYKDFLLEMPASARMWFNDLPKVMRSRVDKFTATYVSPVLVERELKAIYSTKLQQAVEGMQIIARPTAREVSATYSLNEVEMEITVCLSPNHPLGTIVVNTEKRAGVVVGQWRYWILQITTFLQYQNGGIIDGLLLWKERVDKRFEGLEECMICFSLVHGSNQSLPKLKCKTCKKKYHAECLYKWFDTSNNSTCPLCRTPMIFR